jgi:hypothetical protein
VSGDNKSFVWAVALTCSTIAVIASWIGVYHSVDAVQRGEVAQNQETRRAEVDKAIYARPKCQCACGSCDKCEKCKGTGCCWEGRVNGK